MDMIKKIGLGIQNFSEFKEKNLIYVDKTKNIYSMIDRGKYYFLSRPRRFGKSLLVNTMEELFAGNKKLFQHYWIYDKWNWSETNTVIKISFTEVSYRKHGLEEALEMYLEKLGRIHSVQFETPSYATRFLELIEKLGTKKRVVILIDEYDKPIIDYLENGEIKQAQENREILKTFYSGVKDQDRFIRFLFITGVSKFSRVSIFSDLNHLSDITMHDDYSTIVGYSEIEMKKYYNDYLKKVTNKLKISEQQLLQKIKEWYNGYSWDGINFLYNPYSLLNLFDAKAFKNFWFETGTPTFLIKKLKESGTEINRSINKLVNESSFNKYDIDNINITAIMFQTGYLTIKNVNHDENRYLLEFPNKEVRDSFLNFAVEHYANSTSDEMDYIVDSLVSALHNNNMNEFLTSLKSLFSSITAKQLDKVKKYEGFYHSIIYIVLKIVGIQIQCEIASNFGATDAVIKTEDYIYIFEFKMGSAQVALNQIKKKQYYAPYLSDKRRIIMVGFSFNKNDRNVVDFLSEEVKK